MLIMTGPANQTQTIRGRVIASNASGLALAAPADIPHMKFFGFKPLTNRSVRIQPDESFDATKGYSRGSFVTNLATNELFVCTDPSPSRATWEKGTFDELCKILEVAQPVAAGAAGVDAAPNPDSQRDDSSAHGGGGDPAPAPHVEGVIVTQ